MPVLFIINFLFLNKDLKPKFQRYNKIDIYDIDTVIISKLR